MKKYSLLFCGLIIGALFFNACTPDGNDVPLPTNAPTITLNAKTGYTSADAQATFKDSLRFSVKTDGTNNLSELQAYCNNVLFAKFPISAKTFTKEIKSTKTGADKDVWKFVVIDSKGQKAEKVVTITGKFGAINDIKEPIILGAQGNVTDPSFVSFNSGLSIRYVLGEASKSQSSIDMFCFYNATDLMCLSSPGAADIAGIFPGTNAPENYATKNLTYFVKTALTTAQYDAIVNDGMLLESYKAPYITKVTNLKAGDVYAFRILKSLKTGLLKVVSVTPGETGKLGFVVKIQK